MIYVLIAGSYTPFALLALDRTWGITILGVVWTVAIGGIAVVILRHRIRVVGITLYLTLGWLAVVTLPWLAGRLGVAKLALLIVGGVLYTVGAVVLGRQRPSPRVFGYHAALREAVAGLACHQGLRRRAVCLLGFAAGQCRHTRPRRPGPCPRTTATRRCPRPGRG
jgi:hemolysin III